VTGVNRADELSSCSFDIFASCRAMAADDVKILLVSSG
jgi:hypothetical protein